MTYMKEAAINIVKYQQEVGSNLKLLANISVDRLDELETGLWLKLDNDSGIRRTQMMTNQDSYQFIPRGIQYMTTAPIMGAGNEIVKFFYDEKGPHPQSNATYLDVNSPYELIIGTHLNRNTLKPVEQFLEEAKHPAFKTDFGTLFCFDTNGNYGGLFAVSYSLEIPSVEFIEWNPFKDVVGLRGKVAKFDVLPPHFEIVRECLEHVNDQIKLDIYRNT